MSKQTNGVIYKISATEKTIHRALVAIIEHIFTRQIVEMFGADTGSYLADQHVQAAGGQPAGPAHAFERLRPMQFHLPRTFGDQIGVDIIHGHNPNTG